MVHGAAYATASAACVLNYMSMCTRLKANVG